jgi:hypothetical protein
MQSLQQQLQSGKDLQGRPLTAQQRADLQQQLQRLQASLQAMQNPNQGEPAGADERPATQNRRAAKDAPIG